MIQKDEIHENFNRSPVDDDDDDQQQILVSKSSPSSSSVDHYPTTEILSNQRQILFDRALGQMLNRHFYLTEYRFPSSDRFEGWIYTYNRHRYQLIISEQFSCSCARFHEDYVCKHFLFVLKRVFNVDLHSLDMRLAIMQYHRFTVQDLELIFRGQLRRLCPLVTPLSEWKKNERLPLTLKRQSIDQTDICPICFERLLIRGKKLVTCFTSCGKSIHENCMKEWKRVKGKSANCPLCQAPWVKPTAAEKAVLDHYTDRARSEQKREKYILCCLYSPPNWC